MQSDLNLLGYAVFSSRPLPEWKGVEYVPQKTPRLSHITFILTGEPGETICFVPVLSAIKENNPKAVIWVYTDSMGKQIFESNPYVDKLEVIPFDRWKSLLWEEAQKEMKLWISAHRHSVRWVCNLSGEPAAAILARLLGRDKAFGLLMDEDGRPVVVGNRWMQYAIEVIYPSLSDELLCEKNVMNKKHMFSLALSCGLSSENTNVFSPDPDIRSPLVSAGEVFIVVCPYTRYETRRWPDSYWRRFCEMIHREYNINVLLLNPYKEDLSEIIRDLDFVKVLEGLDIGEIAYYISRSRSFVSGHNGFIYIAGALGVPTFVICGQRSKGPGFRGIHLSLRKEIPCAPCSLNLCPRRYCLTSLRPEDVMPVFQLHWQLVGKGLEDPSSSSIVRELRGFVDQGLILELYDSSLPDIMYKYTRLSMDYTDDIIEKISNIAFLYVWNMSNRLLLKEENNLDFSQYIDWALSKDVDWNRFNSAIKHQIKSIKDLEQKLGLLVLRLRDTFPRFGIFAFTNKMAVDPENLWDSLLSFEETVPKIIRKLIWDSVVRDPYPKALDNIREWVKEKKRLLNLLKYYREFLERFLFTRH